MNARSMSKKERKLYELIGPGYMFGDYIRKGFNRRHAKFLGFGGYSSGFFYLAMERLVTKGLVERMLDVNEQGSKIAYYRRAKENPAS